MKELIIPICVFVFLSCNNTDKRNINETTIAATAEEEEYALNVNKGLLPDTLKKSVPRVCTAVIGSNEISINYFSPGVRGRMIWGGLVPYEQVWVTGAHSATKVSFTKDIQVGSTIVPAGTYAIFTIPDKSEWTFILNSNYQQHLTDDYKEAEDIVRINIQPEKLKDTVQRLTYEIKPQRQNSGTIHMTWETIKLSIPFIVLQQPSAAYSMNNSSKKLTGIKTDARRDPVCYMPVTAGITDTVFYKKKLYGFCSAECKRLFKNDPAQYLANLKE